MKKMIEQYNEEFSDDHVTIKRISEVFHVFIGIGILARDEINKNEFQICKYLHAYKTELLRKKIKQLVLLQLIIQRNKEINQQKSTSESIKSMKIPFIIICLKDEKDPVIIRKVSNPEISIEASSNPILSLNTPFDVINIMKFTDNEKRNAINKIKILQNNLMLKNLVIREIFKQQITQSKLICNPELTKKAPSSKRMETRNSPKGETSEEMKEKMLQNFPLTPKLRSKIKIINSSQ